MLAFPLHLALMTGGRFPFAGHRARPHLQPDRPAPADRRRRAAVAAGVGDADRAPPSRAAVLDPHRGPGRRGGRVGGELDQPQARRAAPRTRPSADGPPSSEGSAGDRDLAAARGPRPPLRLGVGRPEPDPRPPADRAAVRLSVRHRPRDVDQGPLPGRARPASCRTRSRVEVAFKRPILLPATVQFAEAEDRRRDPVRGARRQARAPRTSTGCVALRLKRLRARGRCRRTSRAGGPAPRPRCAARRR